MSAIGLAGQNTAPQNLLLNALTRAPNDRLTSLLRPTVHAANHLLFAPGEVPKTVYFPDGAVVSVALDDDTGAEAEAARVGREGAVGLVEGLAGLPLDCTCRVMLAGRGWTVPVAAVRALVEDDPLIRQRVSRYVAMTLAQTQRAVICRALHGARGRMAHAILDCAERTGSPHVALTQQMLANVLGICRTTVTALLGDLARQDLVSLGRGRVSIRDVERMRAAACACADRTNASRGVGTDLGRTGGRAVEPGHLVSAH